MHDREHLQGEPDKICGIGIQSLYVAGQHYGLGDVAGVDTVTIDASGNVDLVIADQDDRKLYSLIEDFARLTTPGPASGTAKLRLGNGICLMNSPSQCHTRPVYGQALPYDFTLDLSYRLERIDTLP